MSQTPHIVEHDTANLKAKTARLTQVAIGLLLVGVLIGVGLTVTTSQQITTLTTLKTEASSREVSEINNQKVMNLISTNPEKMSQIQKVFPTETTIVDFLQTLESLVKTKDPAATVKFSALTPVKVENQLTIPFTIQLKATPIDIISLLQRIERLPYIIEISSVDAPSPQGLGSPGDAVISAKVYVQDPFNQ